jgi:dipeptidyl aminopeptidase/acylaminoacyl peptidase
VKSGVSVALTADSSGAESFPAFAPDGRQIAYVANDYDDPQAAGRDEIRLVSVQAGSKPQRLLSTWSPNHQHLEWSPDGRQLAFLIGSEPKYNAYIMDQLAVAEVPSGKIRSLTETLDRAVITPHFSTDGRAIQFAVEDDGVQYAAQVSLVNGAVERLEGASVATELTTAAGHTALLGSDDRTPVEVYALERGHRRALSSHNRELFTQLALGSVEDISFQSSDGVQIHGQLVKPPGYVPGRLYPTIVWIHGGPNGQDDHSLQLEGYSPQLDRQLFATHGYVALAVNYRGSTGRGAEFARSIAGDWGDKEVDDLLAGADYLVGAGIADPERLGIGGWSYGGLLTDYTIARDVRFRAAISGAGCGNQIATWGTDEYTMQYNAELGPPWREPELWQKVSYPLFRADHIRTPTLFLGGDRDFNVPIAGSEQMFQALRTLGVPAQLIVYPGERHVPERPSFLVDRYRRYLDWMAHYLGAASIAD